METWRLEVGEFPVEKISFGNHSFWANGILTIDQKGLVDHLQDPEYFTSIEVYLAQPGDDTRIIHILDTLDARVKVAKNTGTYPGFDGQPYTAGSGRTHRLDGATIMISSTWPQQADGLLQPREAIVDMAGLGAPYSMFSNLKNIVLVFRPNPNVTNVEYDGALRRAGIKASTYLGGLVRELEPVTLKTYDLAPVDPALPRVVYIDQVQSQGLFAQTFIYGKHSNELLPTVIHPNELLDGALVSGVYVYGCVKKSNFSTLQ